MSKAMESFQLLEDAIKADAEGSDLGVKLGNLQLDIERLEPLTLTLQVSDTTEADLQFVIALDGLVDHCMREGMNVDDIVLCLEFAIGRAKKQYG